MIDSMLRELHYPLHSLRRSPTFTLTTLLTLTCAMAVNVGIFATLNAVALRRLPAPRPHELVRLSTSFRTGQEVPFSFPMFRELAARQQAVLPLIASTDTVLTVKARERERIDHARRRGAPAARGRRAPAATPDHRRNRDMLPPRGTPRAAMARCGPLKA